MNQVFTSALTKSWRFTFLLLDITLVLCLFKKEMYMIMINLLSRYPYQLSSHSTQYSSTTVDKLHGLTRAIP